VNSGIQATANIVNRPTSAFFYTSNNNHAMNQSVSSSNIPNAQSTSTGNLIQSNHQTMMLGHNQILSSAHPTHISHPNLSGAQNTNMLTNASRSTVLPTKMIMQQHQQTSGFLRDNQSQHSLRQNQHQNQMLAPSMPNIAHASGYANNIPASQSMQNMNQIPSNYPLYSQGQQQIIQQMVSEQMPHIIQHNPQLSPNVHHQSNSTLMRGQSKLVEASEQIKRPHRNLLPNGSGQNFSGPMDMISSPSNLMMSPAHNLHTQSPQKQMPPNTAPKPQVILYHNAQILGHL
jgi:hypothetical protein